jgi:hypothetical protein
MSPPRGPGWTEAHEARFSRRIPGLRQSRRTSRDPRVDAGPTGRRRHDGSEGVGLPQCGMPLCWLRIPRRAPRMICGRSGYTWPSAQYPVAVSESAETVVRLDLDSAGVEIVAGQLTEFLSTRGIIVANPDRDDLWQPSRWSAGPAWLSVLEPHPEIWRNVVNNGVEIVVERQAHHPYENYEPPTCAQCMAAYDAEAHHAGIDPCLAGNEPTLTCHVCGWSALAGDWPAAWAVAVGAPAVVFNNWPPLSRSFIAELRAVMGGRTQVVRSHY